MTLPLLLSFAALLTGFLHIRAEYRGPQRQIYLFKPLTTSLIILLALLSPSATSPIYKWLIVLGLLCSLAGDIFLMLPQNRFLPGLISFLFAHLWYIAAFSLDTTRWLTHWGLLPLIAYGLVMVTLLVPHVKPKLRLPVLIYVLVILIMAWRAVEQWTQLGSRNSALALAGALLFVLSDSALALNRFRKPFRSAQAIILSSYYLAQWLIALSI
jgi:uncharacterized membrane protein YhhN